MISIPKSIVDSIYSQGEDAAPLEVCGYLAGKDNRITKQYVMYNEDQSAEHFSFNPKEQFKVIREVRAEGLEIIAVYHTHPATPARPSREDIRLAFDPDIIYIIASLVKDKSIKAFQIRNKVVSAIELDVIELKQESSNW